MKKILTMCLSMLAVFAACSSEDALTPEADDTVSHFLPADGDNSQEAQIRRQFFADEGSYLLFNDTIRHQLLGTDSAGNGYYRTETIDISYSVGDASGPSRTYKYEYLTSAAEKQAAADFVKNQLLSHLQAKSLRPFSWLAVKNITENSSGTEYKSVKGERCIAVALGDIANPNVDKQALSTSIMSSMLGGLITSNEEALADFYAVCSAVYGSRFTTDRVEENEWKQILSQGFVKRAVNQWSGNILWGWYPEKEEDANAYVELVLSNTAEEVAAKYADYPLVIKKYQLMRQVFESVGYKF